MLLRLPLSIVAPAGPKGRLSILIFHRVLPRPDPLFADLPDAAKFERDMRWVRDWFNVLPLPAAIERLYEGTLPARAMAITFDDGYADNEQFAAPILQRLGLSATFFVSTGFLGGGCMWNDRIIEAVRSVRGDRLDLCDAGFGHHALAGAAPRRAAIEALLDAIKHLEPAEREGATAAVVRGCGSPAAPTLMMEPEQVRSLRRMGMDVGAHTVTHPILTRLAPEAARAEMQRSKSELEAMLGERVDLFAYPNGVPGRDYAAEHARMARDCGFSAAVSTAWGAASAASDRFQLPRFTPWDRTKLRYGARLLANYRRREAVAA